MLTISLLQDAKSRWIGSLRTTAMKNMIRVITLSSLPILGVLAQTPSDPFPAPIPATEGVIRVNYQEFASLPDIDGVAARMMNLVTEPGTRNVFVSDMRGQLYRVS